MLSCLEMFTVKMTSCLGVLDVLESIAQVQGVVLESEEEVGVHWEEVLVQLQIAFPEVGLRSFRDS